MSPLELGLTVGSVMLTIQTIYSTALMLYAWEDEEKLRKIGAAHFSPPPGPASRSCCRRDTKKRSSRTPFSAWST